MTECWNGSETISEDNQGNELFSDSLSYLISILGVCTHYLHAVLHNILKFSIEKRILIQNNQANNLLKTSLKLDNTTGIA